MRCVHRDGGRGERIAKSERIRPPGPGPTRGSGRSRCRGLRKRVMHLRTFGGDPTRVSEVGLGTWQFGGTEWGSLDEADAIATLRAAADAGITFLDTADIYGLGRSERIIGQFLRKTPDD